MNLVSWKYIFQHDPKYRIASNFKLVLELVYLTTIKLDAFTTNWMANVHIPDWCYVRNPDIITHPFLNPDAY